MQRCKLKSVRSGRSVKIPDLATTNCQPNLMNLRQPSDYTGVTGTVLSYSSLAEQMHQCRVLVIDRGDVRIRGTMSCKDTIHLICWYLERKLSPSVENEIERHLSECRDCHLVFDAANTTLDRYFGPARTTEGETARTAA